MPEWSIIDDWLDTNRKAELAKEKPMENVETKNKEIRKLENYKSTPDEEFWKTFPKRGLPTEAATKINVRKLEEYVENVKGNITISELRRAKKVILDLKHGAEAYQKEDLPPIRTRNAESAFEHGEALTDEIATWIKKGYVAGPFNCSPVPEFRTNPLAVVVKNGKVRPILNMSGPKGKSFNDNVRKEDLEKIHMATAKKFGHALREAGQDALFSKFDIKDAYKLVPAKTSDLRLQGFSWLGKFFVETQQTFGGIPSVSNFDRLGRTKDLIVCMQSKVPRRQVFRVLDDSPCVCPAGTDGTRRFTEKMREVCKEINLPLADNCPKQNKAFELQKRGVVLGIGFDSSNLTWFLPEEKADKLIRRCWQMENAMHADLKQTQKLMGSVNDMAQMCPLMKVHKQVGTGS